MPTMCFYVIIQIFQFSLLKTKKNKNNKNIIKYTSNCRKHGTRTAQEMEEVPRVIMGIRINELMKIQKDMNTWTMSLHI